MKLNSQKYIFWLLVVALVKCWYFWNNKIKSQEIILEVYIEFPSICILRKSGWTVLLDKTLNSVYLQHTGYHGDDLLYPWWWTNNLMYLTACRWWNNKRGQHAHKQTYRQTVTGTAKTDVSQHSATLVCSKNKSLFFM